MRLTLRTMLAYLDNILKAEDSQEIGRKIEESEVAQGLMQRVRDVMRRLRLPAPSVSDRSGGLDPNTVAEYLDNTLPAERVPDFEKVCLEPGAQADVQLAEVASCHQILTLVLGEPAEVDTKSRQRMYGLPEELEAEGEAAPAGSPTPPPLLPESPPLNLGPARRRRKARVPEYLREPARARRRMWPPVVLGLVVVMVVTAVALALSGQFQPGSWLMDTWSGAKTPAAGTTTAATRPVEPPAQPSVPAAGDKQPTPPAKPLETVAATVPAAKPQTDMPTGAAATGGPVGAVPPPTLPAPPAAPTTAAVAAAKPGPGELARNDVKLPPPPTSPATPDGKSPAGLVNPANAMVAPPPSPPAGPASKPPAGEAPPPVPPERAGRYVSDRQMLVKYDATVPGWLCVQPQAIVITGVSYVSLPTFKPTIALTSGATVDLLGGTRLELLPADAQGLVGINVAYGRIIVRPVGETKVRFRLQCGRQSGIVSLKNVESIVAAEVRRLPLPGVDPEADPGVLRADLYCRSGELTWEDLGPSRQAITLAASSSLALSDQPLAPPTQLNELPKWITGDETSARDKLAQPLLEAAIADERPASLVIRELANHRRSEVAALAVRCLSFMGDFEPMVVMLSSSDPRVWDDCIAQLRMALTRGPEVAGETRRALEKKYPQDAGVLYRMLWGYTDRDLTNGQAQALVQLLDHDQLACRVLAIYNLDRLLGARYGYKANDPPSKRLPIAMRFKERLQGGSPPRPAEKKETGSAEPPLPTPPADK